MQNLAKINDVFIQVGPLQVSTEVYVHLRCTFSRILQIYNDTNPFKSHKRREDNADMWNGFSIAAGIAFQFSPVSAY